MHAVAVSGCHAAAASVTQRTCRRAAEVLAAPSVTETRRPLRAADAQRRSACIGSVLTTTRR